MDIYIAPHPTPLVAFMRATRQVIALSAELVTAHTDLWLHGPNALANARAALARISRDRVTATVPYKAVLNLVAAADGPQQHHRLQARIPRG